MTVYGHNQPNGVNDPRKPRWQRAVAALLAFIPSVGGVAAIAAVAAYAVTASTVHVFPFGSHPKAHAPSSPPTAISPGPGPSPSPGPTHSASPAASICAPAAGTETLTLVGSTAFAAIAQVAATMYHDQCGANIVVDAKDSASGFTILHDAVTKHLGNANSIIAMYDGTDMSPAPLVAQPMGLIIFAIVANKTHFHESSIKVGDLMNFFAPASTVGVVKPGPVTASVIAVGRLKGSGSREALLKGALGLPNWGSVAVGTKSCPPPSKYTACTEDYTWQVLNAVNAIPNAIGYAGYTEFLQDQPQYPQVYEINIGTAAPGPQAVKDKSYRFWAVEHVYTSMHPTTLATDFLTFLADYLGSHPQDGFVACPAVPKNLGTDCPLSHG